MCLALTWETTWMGLWPQPPCQAVVCPSGGTQKNRQLTKAWPTRASCKVVRTHPLHIHSICRLWNTHMCLTLKWEPLGLVYSLDHCTPLWFAPQKVHKWCRVTFKSKATDKSSNVVRIQPYTHPQNNMKVVKQPLCVAHWIGGLLGWVFRINHSTLCCGLPLRGYTEFYMSFKS